ncbi:hypothetical protein SAMN04488543_2784 [Friedmanniella luteola]|uniref:Uncharacterized protein n=1 Tax=Friedmanniella luteola TaxID=546871 RepID=A0A1H1WQ22_9ACTN|nr:hypothetical protein [Friedmanniella luteola]SDS98731.1 hypothetical protein SAMN04488543_2784 [Friedmanniella luteola]
MNDLDEFVEVALAIFVAISGLVALLTHLERTLYSDVRLVAGSRHRISQPEQPPIAALTPVNGEDEEPPA